MIFSIIILNIDKIPLACYTFLSPEVISFYRKTPV